MRVVRAYHGTTAEDFSTFRPYYRKKEQLGFGIGHFSEDQSFAELYAFGEMARKGKGVPRVYVVDLNVENPLDADTLVMEGSKEFALAQKLAGRKLYATMNERGQRIAYMEHAINNTTGQRAEKLIREAGYGAVSYEATIKQIEAQGFRILAKSVSWIVFDPNQIKIVSVYTKKG